MEWNRSSACTQGSCVEVAWERSSFCSSATNCVEVARPVTWTVSSYCANGSCIQVGWAAASACASGTCVEVGWRKSTASATNCSCVEVNCQCHDGKVYVRDSKLGEHSPVMTFTSDDWAEFCEMVLRGGIPDDAIEPIEGGLWIAVGDGDYLRFTEDEWDAFVKGVRAGEFTVSEGVSS